MHAFFKIFTFVWAALLSIAISAPTDMGAADLKPRAFDAFFEGWSDLHYKGFHKRYEVQYDVCTIISGDFPPGTEAGLSSVQVGPMGTSECILFPNTNCDFGRDIDHDRLYCGGFYDDLNDPEIGWKDRAYSFKCVKVKHPLIIGEATES